ncbi:MAG: tRNA (adenosine(37)-N6)-dimethylallyltransferase MiaA [Spirochaetales bacterium]|nr:tRNA (adenosine(37)-N6)-dimethylallyltransferase MiaA [Spirochaetales bacterium]
MVEKLVYIVGPTASGKTKISNNLAIHFNIPILSLDSMQIYKEMDIGTSKPSYDELKNIKYFGIDIIGIDFHYSAAQYIKYAKEVISKVSERLILIVGGTGLYYDGLTLGFSKIPPMDKRIRENLFNLYKENGIDFLYQKLCEVDNEYSQKIAKNDLKRIIRALEVYEITKKPFSFFHKEKDIEPLDLQNKKFGIYLPRKRLYNTIDKRVDLMFENGFIEEAEILYKKYINKDLPALKALGYFDLFEYFEGKISLEKAKENIKQKTRNYAKRQLTWFKRDNDIKWLILLNENEYDIAKNIKLDNFNEGKLKRKKNRLNFENIEFELKEFINSTKYYEFILENNVVEYLKNEIANFMKD